MNIYTTTNGFNRIDRITIFGIPALDMSLVNLMYKEIEIIRDEHGDSLTAEWVKESYCKMQGINNGI